MLVLDTPLGGALISALPHIYFEVSTNEPLCVGMSSVGSGAVLNFGSTWTGSPSTPC